MVTADPVIFDVSVGPSQWDKTMGGWRCTVLRTPGIEVSGLYSSGGLVDPKKYTVDKDAEVIRWATGSPPKSALAKLKLAKTLAPKKQVDKWKIVSIVLTLAGIATTIWAASAKPLNDPIPSSPTANVDILRTFKSTSDARGELDALLGSGERELLLSGINFHITLNDNQVVLTDAARKGADVKILIMAPDSEDLDDWVVDRHLLQAASVRNEIENTIRGYCQIQGVLEDGSGATGSIELRYHRTAPDFRLYASDPQRPSGKLLYVPYLSGTVSARSPVYLLKLGSPGTLGDSFLRSAMHSWRRATRPEGICDEKDVEESY